MAEQLTAMYEEAKKLGGVKAVMRMAILTKVPSNKAATEPDSAENVALFKKALSEIEKENR